ncbi:hypothetical protein L1987_70511 [Smallanthus sonchifolius]|uniref:Uncharacterized protein n=1 Tax=Smallanthus sonchifolius TaxID=185202 RepID=A0ACB9AP86_9ASTR|nr:hypothetical protein L1987_70511 [Smallanthus sonchifolius]
MSEEDPSEHYVPGEFSYATSSEDLGSRLPSPTSVLPPPRVAPVTVVLHPATPAIGQSLFPGSTFEVGGSSTRTAHVIIELSSDEEEEPEDTRTNREASELNKNQRMDRFEKRVYSRLAIFVAFFVLLVAVVLGFYFRH